MNWEFFPVHPKCTCLCILVVRILEVEVNSILLAMLVPVKCMKYLAKASNLFFRGISERWFLVPLTALVLTWY